MGEEPAGVRGAGRGRRARLAAPSSINAVIAFVAFCLAASGTYYLNDASDMEADRLHPKKRFRPIAAGEVPVGLARVLGPLLIVAGVGLGFAATLAAVAWWSPPTCC